MSRAASGCDSFRAACAHPLQPARDRQEVRDGFGQPHASSLVSSSTTAAPARSRACALTPLVIVGGARERNEDGWLTCGRDFRNRAGARAAEQQVGPGKEGGHVVDEGRTSAEPCQLLIRGLRVIISRSPV